MKSYEEIKKEELEGTSKYTDNQFNLYFKFLKVLRSLFTESFLWFASIIVFIGVWSVFHWLGFFPIDFLTITMFVVSHFIYWILKGKKSSIELIDDVAPELDLILKALGEIKEIRKNG